MKEEIPGSIPVESFFEPPRAYEVKRAAARQWIEDIIGEFAKAREEGVKQGLTANPHDLARTVLALRGGGWTTIKPTEPGWYWAACNRRGWRWQDPLTVRVVSPPGKLEVLVSGSSHRYSCNDFTHFLGPLTVPEPPE